MPRLCRRVHGTYARRGRFAQCLAAMSILVAAVFLADTSIFSYDLPDTLWWALGAYLVIHLIKNNKPRLWLLFGLVIGLLLTPRRAFFRTRLTCSVGESLRSFSCPMCSSP